MRLGCQTRSKTSLPGLGSQKAVERGAKEGEDISGALHLSMPLSPTIPLLCCGLFQERFLKNPGLLFNFTRVQVAGQGFRRGRRGWSPEFSRQKNERCSGPSFF